MPLVLLYSTVQINILNWQWHLWRRKSSCLRRIQVGYHLTVSCNFKTSNVFVIQESNFHYPLFITTYRLQETGGAFTSWHWTKGTLDRSPVHHTERQTTIHRHTHTYGQFRVTNLSNLHVFGLCLGGSRRTLRERTWTHETYKPCPSLEPNTGPSWCEVTLLTTALEKWLQTLNKHLTVEWKTKTNKTPPSFSLLLSLYTH